MNNVKQTIWNIKIPPFIGILFLILSIGTIGWLSSNAVLFGTKAAVDSTPKNVLVANISDSSFAVLYETDGKTTGTIQYGTGGATDQVVLDDRDKEKGSPSEYAVHYITVKNLKPSTKYFFTITSGNKNFSNNDKPYETETAASVIPNEMVVTGKIVLDDGSLPPEAIAYILTPDQKIMSALIVNDGKYQINIPSSDPNNILILQISDSIRKSKISLLASQSSTVPLIILSKDYDFTKSNEPLPSSSIASASGTITPAFFPNGNGEISTKPQIISPENGQEFKDPQPLFIGTAVPGADVEITIESEETINTTVQANSNGNWQYRPSTKLAPGTHTITIRTIDASGIVRTITQSFVVFAAGSEFTEPSVSPSVSPTTAPSPTINPTAAPTIEATLTPTTAVSTPTSAPTVAVTTSITNPPVPITGNTSLLLTIIGAVSAITVGALLFIFTAL